MARRVAGVAEATALADPFNEASLRARLLDVGVEHLSDVELLALVAGPGRTPAWTMATFLLGRYQNVSEISRLPATELANFLGVGDQRSARLCAALELGRRAQRPRDRAVRLDTPEAVYAYARPRMAHLTREVFHVLLLDTKHRLMADRRVAEGGLATCALSPRDVFEPVIREAAPAVVFIHVHPSGDPTPSRDDVALTARLAEAATVLGISLLDHVVIADGGYASLREQGAL